ncbi:MAG: HNH endonuclease [Erythrobacter sp.]
MVTFNELLVANGVSPADVALVRHSGRRHRSVTPYDLWQRADGSFDLYQSTQTANRAVFRSPYWASFVSDPDNATLFVGVYSARIGDPHEINWLCPITGVAPGADRGAENDFYHLTLLDTLREHRGALKIQWDKGYVAWARYASRSHHAVIGDVDLAPLDAFTASQAGEATWQLQKRLERDPRLSRKALARNADANGGTYTCDACGFQHPDRAMFDVHHAHPLLAGPRQTQTSDLIVLCPVCHRRAHRSPNRMLPYDLEELRAWNDAGRP